MNDSMYEQLVARKARITDHLIRIFIIAVIAALLIIGPAIIGFFALVLALVVALLAIFLIFPRLNVEYEYNLLNHDMQVDIIYNRSRRKSLAEFDILRAEAILPKGSPDIKSYHAERTYDFTSGAASQGVYAILVNVKQQRACVLIEPDETMKQHINNWTSSSMRLS